VGDLDEDFAEHLFHVQEVEDAQEKLEDLQEEMVDEIVTALNERTPATLPGVDLAAIKQADPQFDVENFRTIARDTFYIVKDARRRQDLDDLAPLLSDKMQGEMAAVINGDVAAHRHHIMPFLTVTEAQIASAAMTDGKERIDVILSLSSAESDIDDETKQVIGDNVEHNWQERWCFQRDPSVDTSATDMEHLLADGADEWFVAHRGWIVIDIQRIG
jgi:predicted lipid-binding transport protein (Tim44 family)